MYTDEVVGERALQLTFRKGVRSRGSERITPEDLYDRIGKERNSLGARLGVQRNGNIYHEIDLLESFCYKYSSSSSTRGGRSAL